MTTGKTLPRYIRGTALQDGHVDHITGPRCIIVPAEGEYKGRYIVARTETVLAKGTDVIFDTITRRAKAAG